MAIKAMKKMEALNSLNWQYLTKAEDGALNPMDDSSNMLIRNLDINYKKANEQSQVSLWNNDWVKISKQSSQLDDDNGNGNRLVLHRHQQEIEVFRKEDKERQRFKDSQKNKGQFQLSMTLSNADFYYIQEALDEKEKPLCKLLDSIRISEYQEKLYANPNLRRLLYLPDSDITFDFETHEAIMKDGMRKKVVKKTHEEVDCNHQHFEESGDEEPSDDQDQSREGDQTEEDQGLQSSELGMKWFSSFSE